MDELKKRQKDEIRALKSIYSDNYTNLNERPANNCKFKITLFPTKSESQYETTKFYVQIDLIVEFTSDYPNEAPIIKLENEKGLSQDQVKSLHSQLVNKIECIKGRELVHDLCGDIEEFLYLNNKPPSKSFFEQRLENKKKSAKNQLVDKVKCNEEDTQLNAEIEHAVDEKKKLLQEERKKEKRERLISNHSPSQTPLADKQDFYTIYREYLEDVDSAVSRKSRQFQAFVIDFTEPQTYRVNCIKLIDFDHEKSLHVYRGLEMTSNELFDVYEWKIQLNTYDKKKLDICMNKMSKIVEEFKNLHRLAATNKSLVKYVAYKYFKDEKNCFIIQICMEYVEGNTVEIFINKRQSYALLDSTIRIYTFQLVEILDFLHSNHIIHRDLNASCVHVDKNGFRIRLSGYSLVKRINNLNDEVAKDAVNEITGSAKSDIHQMGLLILSLVLGETLAEYHPRVPMHLESDLKNFITICLKDLDKIDCKFLRTHEYLTKSLENDESKFKLMQTKRTISNNCDGDDDDLRKFTDYPVQSRLNMEFEVIGVVGQGAFGEVLKVKNKLDSRFYAIKRIRINPNSKQLNKQITREIKLLSMLNHENVVRYYSTWIEQYEEEETNPKTALNDEKKKGQSTTNGGDISPSAKKLVKFRSVSNGSSSSDESNAGLVRWNNRGSCDKDVISINSLSTSSLSSSSSITSSLSKSSLRSMSASSLSRSSISSSSSAESINTKKNVNFHLDSMSRVKRSAWTKLDPENSSDDDSIIFADENENPTEAKEQKSSVKTTHNKPDNEKKTAKLKRKLSEKLDESAEDYKSKRISTKFKRQFIYIQMEYCGGKTLKHLIDNGLYEKEDKVWRLLREILQGLNHIHEQGMIHRDLKPGNVLIDKSGHAKIGDFGLATTKLVIQNDHLANETTFLPIGDNNSACMSNSHKGSLSNNVVNASGANDSTSMSGAVGTALYVAPELEVPSTKNKYVYTQKVDIYSLGIMFYEMCFPFDTSMERIFVIKNLRLKDIIISENIRNQKKYDKQIHLIELMLNHDPNARPSAKDLLLNELIPRKADEIALDELLKYSLNNKQSTSYKKIMKAIFEQKTNRIDDASFDSINCKHTSFKYLQIQENVNNMLTKIFQKHGGYMISYPLLTPTNPAIVEFERIFKVTDSSGLVVSLPYNHRMPFARYLARSGLTNIKRYYIGKVYSEKLKLTSLHPREHMEACFDIVTSTNLDCLPEIELLTVVNDVINSSSELNDQNYLLVINHSLLLNSIMSYSGINESMHKKIYQLLSEYNNKLYKASNVSKETRMNWLKDRLPHLNLNSNEIEKLLNYLLKYGDPNKVLSELRTLTKSESNFSKLAKDAINQLKQICNNLASFDIKINVELSTSFVLPVISNPTEYSGFIFQLLVSRKNNKNEYEILASGGRYDNMIAQFRNKNLAPQFAVGVSFDYEKIVNLINDKSKKNIFRSELVICNISDGSISNTNVNNNNSVVLSKNLANTNSINNLTGRTMSNTMLAKKKTIPNLKEMETQIALQTNGSIQSDNLKLAQLEAKNRLLLYKQLSLLNRNLNISTHMLHERFLSVDDVDEYCKKHNINSYVYLNDSSTMFTSKILSANFAHLNSDSDNNNGNNTSTSSSSSSITAGQSLLKIRSLIDRGYKFLEKKFNLNDFLISSNNLINNMATYSSVSCNFLTGQNWPFQLTNPASSVSSTMSSTSSNFGSNHSLASSGSSVAPTNLNINNNNSNQTSQMYAEFISNFLNISQNSSMASTINSHYSPSTPSTLGALSVTSSSSTLNFMSQMNITTLLDTSVKSQIMNMSNKKKLESVVVSKISHIFSLFSSRTRIEIIVLELPDIVLQTLANSLHLEMDEQYFSANWNQCLEQITNLKHRKQLCNLRLDETLKELRYVKRSKVFILYNSKSEQFKLLVAP